MAQVLAPKAKPTARRDIISAILSHYGDERDVDDHDHDHAYYQPSPTPAPVDRASKALPSVPALTQPRDRGRDACRNGGWWAGMPQHHQVHYRSLTSTPIHLNSSCKMKMASPTPQPAMPSVTAVERLGSRLTMYLRMINVKTADQHDKGSTQEPRAHIMAPRSLSRSKRPPELLLVKSNGSTATSAKTPSQSSSPLADSPSLQPPERGRRHARGRLDDELPLTPPPPELPNKSDDDTMGSRSSKLQHDDKEASPPRRLHHFSLRRKPVRKSTSAAATATATATATAADPPVQPAPLTVLHETTVQPSQEPPAPPIQLDKVKADEALVSSSSSIKHARGPSNAVSEPITEQERHHAPEPSEDTVRIRRERSNTPPSEPDPNEPITPPLKPGDPVQLLPSPTPVPEESPSKWGLVRRPSNLNVMNEIDAKSNLHFRGKSSTGFDIFKTTSNELKATTPLTPVRSPTIESTPALYKENQKLPASPTKPPTPPKDTPPTSPPALPPHHLFNSRLRPKRTTAAMLNRIQTACYHAHGRFHRSNQRFFPIDCMMCFANPPDHQWTCTWCALRICQTCRSKLDAAPHRNLELLIQGRLQEWEKQQGQRDSMRPQRNSKAETVRVKGRERSSIFTIGKLSRGSRSEPLAAGSRG